MKKPMDELEVLRHLMLATTHRQTMVRKYGAGIMDRLQRDRLILLTETGLYKVGVRGRERLEELLAMPDDEPEAPLRESSKEGKRRYPGRLGSVVKGKP